METQWIRSNLKIRTKQYSYAFKKIVVREYEKGLLNKEQLRTKYKIKGKSTVLEWCREFGKLHYPEKGVFIGRPMKDPQKQRIKELEKQLANEKLKVIAYEKLIEIAEREEGISISKKDVVKQLRSLDKHIPGK